MGMLIINGHGGGSVDGPTFWVDSSGHVHRIPGWNPESKLNFRIANVLVQSIRSQLGVNAKEITAIAKSHIQKGLDGIAKGIEGESSMQLSYADEDGGFHCGTPWPHKWGGPHGPIGPISVLPGANSFSGPSKVLGEQISVLE